MATSNTPLISSQQLQLAVLQLIEKAGPNPPSKQATLSFPHSSGGGNEAKQQDLTKLLSFLPQKTKMPPAGKIPSKPKEKKKPEMNPKKPSICLIPYNRVRMIMKTAPNITSLSQEAITIATKATELLIARLAQDAYETSKSETESDKKEVDYSHLGMMILKNFTLLNLQNFISKVHQKKCKQI
jgi:ribosome-binding ATPase YchF (GTP1/OBG family)